MHADTPPFRKQTKLRETLNNLILKSPQDWPTGAGLPFVRAFASMQIPAYRFSPIPTLLTGAHTRYQRGVGRIEIRCEAPPARAVYAAHFQRCIQAHCPCSCLTPRLLADEGVSRMQTSLRRRHVSCALRTTLPCAHTALRHV